MNNASRTLFPSYFCASQSVFGTCIALSLALPLACSSDGGGDDEPGITTMNPTTGMVPDPETSGGNETETGTPEPTTDAPTTDEPTTDDPETEGDSEDSGDEDSMGETTGPEEMDEPFVHSCENEVDDDADDWTDCEDRGCFAYSTCEMSLDGEYINYAVTGLSAEYAYSYTFGEGGACSITETMGGDPVVCTYEISGDGTVDAPYVVVLTGEDDTELESFYVEPSGEGLWLRGSASSPSELFGKATTYEGAVAGVPAEYLAMGPIEIESDLWHRGTHVAAWEVQASADEKLHVSTWEYTYDKAGSVNFKLFGPLDAAEEDQAVLAPGADAPAAEQTFDVTTAGRYLLFAKGSNSSLYRVRVNHLDADSNALSYRLSRAQLATVNSRPLVARAADMNGDDRMDLLVVNGSSSGSSADDRKVLVYLQSEAGALGTAVAYPFQGEEPAFLTASSIVAADFNGDEEMDVAVGHSAGVSVLLGQGEGVLGDFAALVEEDEGGTGTTGTETGTGGGEEEEEGPTWAHVALLDGTAGAVQIGVVTSELATRYKSDDSGAFTETDSLKIRPESDVDVVVGDADGDGTLDMLVAAGSEDRAAFHIIDGAEWTAEEHRLEGSNYSIRARSIAMGDMTGDGKAEVMVGHTGVNSPRVVSQRIQVFRRLVSGRYELIDRLEGTTQDMHALDLDGDEVLELVAVNAVQSGVSVYRNREGGWLANDYRVDSTVSIGVESLAVADFDGDGCMDIATAVNRGRVDLYTGEGCPVAEEGEGE